MAVCGARMLREWWQGITQQQAHGGVMTHRASMHGALSDRDIHTCSFGGDGMVHACHVHGGKASCSNRLMAAS